MERGYWLVFGLLLELVILGVLEPFYWCNLYRGADKSLATPGREPDVRVRSLMGKGMD